MQGQGITDLRECKMQIIKNADLDPDLAAAHQVEIKPIKLEMMELPGQRERVNLS